MFAGMSPWPVVDVMNTASFIDDSDALKGGGRQQSGSIGRAADQLCVVVGDDGRGNQIGARREIHQSGRNGGRQWTLDVRRSRSTEIRAPDGRFSAG